MRKILLLCLALAAWADQTFTDKVTGLMWQDNAVSAETKMSWPEAVDYCDALKLDGYDDWRLPGVKELYTIVDLHREDPALIPGFRYRASKDYWSATQVVGDRDDAWLVYFEDGQINHYSKTRERNVRCVRRIKPTKH